jgi:hypothetical protein
MRHSSTAVVRLRGVRPWSAASPALDLRLGLSVSRDRFVLVERFRTIETLFTAFLRVIKIVSPIFGGDQSIFD